MDRVEVTFSTSSGYRPTETVADLRNATETLFFPLRMVGYWDRPSRDHLCPQDKLGARCPHVLPAGDPAHVDYQVTVERDLDAALEVYFPHAQVHLYLT